MIFANNENKTEKIICHKIEITKIIWEKTYQITILRKCAALTVIFQRSFS